MVTSLQYNFNTFSLREMTLCGSTLRKLGDGAKTMEAATTRIVRYLRDSFVDPNTGQSAIALARCFKTQPYSTLYDPTLQAQARAAAGGQDLAPQTSCLTLLATAGTEPDWNDRHRSKGHQAIPLIGQETIQALPMIARLLQQLGIGTEAILDPDFMVDLELHTFNVFHVPEAIASPYIPAQEEFVIPYGIRSVLGFGSVLPSRQLVTFILFSTVDIPRSTADQFKTLALNAKFALLPFDGGIMFR